jgi:hypothetical protein
MKIVTCRVHGGLGNQLFSYAAARAISLRNGARLKIDDVSGFVNDVEYKRSYSLSNFNISSEKITVPPSRYKLRALKFVSRFFKTGNKLYVEQGSIDYDPEIIKMKVESNLYITGYWQSEKYFKDVEGVIRSDLEFVIPTEILSLALVSKIKSVNSVSVHIRVFDNIASDKTNNISKDYYVDAINKIEQLVSDPHYFIFSNDVQVAIDMNLWEGRNVIFMTQQNYNAEDYIDMWIMSQCKHFIIANSTFSWWGAWLSKSNEKLIVAPKKEIRHGVMWWGFDGLIPESWIKI